MVLLVLLAVAWLLSEGVRRRWRWVIALARWWRGVRRPLWAWVRTAPVTNVYLALLAFTTWLLLRTSPQLRTAFLSSQSTNLHQLSINPIPVLLRSAFYVTPTEWMLWLVTFTLVLAPLERWIGSVRWLVAFWTGHIGATLVTAVGIWWAIRTGQASPGVAFMIDVGASYGFATLLGLTSYWFAGRGRWLWSIGFLALWIAIVAFDTDVTEFGHLVAYLLGLALYPMVRGLTPRRPVVPDAVRWWGHPSRSSGRTPTHGSPTRPDPPPPPA